MAALDEAPPADLARLVAHRESETQAERSHYAYRQSVRLSEMSDRGAEVGFYRERRDVIFSPSGERTERMVDPPVANLKNLRMTDEDFRDLRDVQPFILVEDVLWNYETRFKGEQEMDGLSCWVLSVKPRNVLQGLRLFEGLLWVKKDDYSVVRSEGQAVPQIQTTKSENLFPRFTTVRKPVNGFWFPYMTYADDTLFFRSGPIREKLVIRYNNYQKFGSDTVITFDTK